MSLSLKPFFKLAKTLGLGIALGLPALMITSDGVDPGDHDSVLTFALKAITKTPHVTETRPLTMGEVALAKRAFGDEIDYATVRINKVETDLHIVPAFTTGNNIWWMGNSYQSDYTNGTLVDSEHFLHEMMHVWQHQHEHKNLPWEAVKLNVKTRFHYYEAYTFNGKERYETTGFNQMNIEQQGTLMEDFVRLDHAATIQRKEADCDITYPEERYSAEILNAKLRGHLPLNAIDFGPVQPDSRCKLSFN